MAKKPKIRKVMFLCAHNQSRSVTAEGLLTGEQGYEVKSRALWTGARRKITKHEGQWADEVYVMMPGMIPVAVEAGINRKKIKSLWIPDNYGACQADLLRELRAQLARYDIHVKKNLLQAQEDCWKIHDRKMGFSFRPEPWWTVEPKQFELPSMKEIDEEAIIEPVFEEEVSGHVTRPHDRFSYREYVPPPERYVPVRGDESEEEIVERARKLWKFYDATDIRQKKLR